MGLSFEKKFWDEALKDPFAIIVGGSCLHIGREKDSDAWGGAFRGFGGSKFKFEIIEDTPSYKKGTIVESSNVWYRGDVPDWCHAKNTAKITEDSPTKLTTQERK